MPPKRRFKVPDRFFVSFPKFDIKNCKIDEMMKIDDKITFSFVFFGISIRGSLFGAISWWYFGWCFGRFFNFVGRVGSGLFGLLLLVSLFVAGGGTALSRRLVLFRLFATFTAFETAQKFRAKTLGRGLGLVFWGFIG